MESLGPTLAVVSSIFLHGFLGRPDDWNQTILNLESLRAIRTHLLDYFSIPALSPQNSFEVWASHFANWVRAELGPGPHALVGYSLGGRLALHALENSPDLFTQGILISTNPGLDSEALDARVARIDNDEIWSQRFMSDSWNILTQDWDRQNVFDHCQVRPAPRLEEQYQRSLLSLALINWSLGRQKNFRPLLGHHPGQTITWLTGGLDAGAMSLHDELKTKYPKLNCQIIEKAGHRILIDAPASLAQFLSNLI